eukprot:gene5794-6291_t
MGDSGPNPFASASPMENPFQAKPSKSAAPLADPFAPAASNAASVNPFAAAAAANPFAPAPCTPVADEDNPF